MTRPRRPRYSDPWNQVDLAIEGELALLAEPGRRGGKTVDLRVDACQTVAMFLQHAAYVVPMRRLDANRAQHTLQRQFHDLLRFARLTQRRRQAVLHGGRLLHAGEPPVGQQIDHQQKIDVGVGPHRASSDRPEHGQCHKTIAVGVAAGLEGGGQQLVVASGDCSRAGERH